MMFKRYVSMYTKKENMLHHTRKINKQTLHNSKYATHERHMNVETRSLVNSMNSSKTHNVGVFICVSR